MGGKDIGIRELKFVAKTQVLLFQISIKCREQENNRFQLDQGRGDGGGRFNSSVNISENCDFRSQFGPFYIIL